MKHKLSLLVAMIIISLLITIVYVLRYYIPDIYLPLKGRILWHGNRSLSEIALTFDDGPNSKATPQILDILNKNGVKATFFVLGKYAEKNNAILKRIGSDGHLIGNHTYTHASGLITDMSKIKRELTRTNFVVAKYTGQNVKYFRPPFGFENWRFLSEAEMDDFSIVLWSLDAGDWNKKSVQDITERILRRSTNGTIILLHDGGASREAVIGALPIVIKGLKKKGFRFVTIDEMVSHL